MRPISTNPQSGEPRCLPPATQTAPASLPAPAAAGQGVGIPGLHCDECGWRGFDDGWMVRCPMCNFPSLVRMESRA